MRTPRGETSPSAVSSFRWLGGGGGGQPTERKLCPRMSRVSHTQYLLSIQYLHSTLDMTEIQMWSTVALWNHSNVFRSQPLIWILFKSEFSTIKSVNYVPKIPQVKNV